MQQPTAATDKAIILIATKSPIHIININYIINWSPTDHQLDHWLHQLHQLHHQLITPSYIISWRMESIQESSHYDVSKNYEKKKIHWDETGFVVLLWNMISTELIVPSWYMKECTPESRMFSQLRGSWETKWLHLSKITSWKKDRIAWRWMSINRDGMEEEVDLKE